MSSASKTSVLVLGATGMLGNAVFRDFSRDPSYHAMGTMRSSALRGRFPEHCRDNLIDGIDVENFDSLASAFAATKPEIVINCIGLVKQLSQANDPLIALPINAILPHRLARLCSVAGARLVHVSTDCVFDGADGNYTEASRPNAYDLYGRSKLLGEVDYDNAITLRTSIIGRELNGAHALIDWFLAQEGKIKGFNRAIFSGLSTVELSRVIKDYVLPRSELHGLYHVSAEPISKFDLLQLVADAYAKKIAIEPDDSVSIDRSLNSAMFREATGYNPPAWPEIVAAMRDFG